jgi:RNA recognition motif-containing protein
MNIYVGFLPDGFNDTLLKEKFAEFGEVNSAKVITDRDTGLSKGFGFVEMSNDTEGQTAIDSLQNWLKPDGRTVKVTMAQERTGNSGGGGNRNSGGYGSRDRNSGGSRDNRNSNSSGGGRRY